MKSEKQETQPFHGVEIEIERLLMTAFSAEGETRKQVQAFYNRMEEANAILVEAIIAPIDDSEYTHEEQQQLLEIKQVIAYEELEKLRPELRDKGYFMFSNTIANGLKLIDNKSTAI